MLSRAGNRIALALGILLAPGSSLSTGAVLTATLQPAALSAWNSYLERAERDLDRPRPLLDVTGMDPEFRDLNPDGGNSGDSLPNAYIHHWVGAVRIPNTTVSAVRGVLEDYSHYVNIYAPDVKVANATAGMRDASGRTYDVHLVTDQAAPVGLHFAFDLRSRVHFREAPGQAFVESRSYSIRECSVPRAPYSDLLPEGRDHGILWRLNSYWRLRQMGSSVYVECQAISLSRKPLLGFHDLVKNRARSSLESTLRRTLNRALGRAADAS
jgi:hypothetical protein